MALQDIDVTLPSRRKVARDYAPQSTDVDSRLRLQTIIRLRWFGVAGQLAAVTFVWIVLGFEFPIGACLVLIAMSAWLNVYLAIRYPARHRLSVEYATALLAYDIVQLAGLLYLTGGIDNPFTLLMVVPVTVSGATLPARNTTMLGALALAATGIIGQIHLPLPWFAGEAHANPPLYRLGILAAVGCSMPFLALYAWRLTKESRLMSGALAATEHVLAREQKVHALDGLAAAAAHELGTPLSTITLVTAELARQLPEDSPYREDVDLLRSQAQRCRVILQKLTRDPAEQDPLHSSLKLSEMLHEAAEPYLEAPVELEVVSRPAGQAVDAATFPEPFCVRMPGVIYGLGNLIENAVDYAFHRVEATAEWDQRTVTITIADDGPGFGPEVIDTLGEPYVTTRSSGGRRKSRSGSKVAGLGLGFFIAKTLLERSGAQLAFENRPTPLHGAVVRITWMRATVEIPASGVLKAPA